MLGDAMEGDATLFAREDYVEEAWRIFDPVLKAGIPVYEYEPNSWGPGEVEQRVATDQRRVSDRIQTYGLFTDPPLGRCGMTDAEIRKSGRPALVAKLAMSRVSRAVEKGETQGFIKITVDAETKQILGAAILGTGGDEVIHVLLDVMYAKAPHTLVQRAMHIHPTVAEFLPTVLSKLEPFA